MRWFRFYDEVLDDPKVQRLPPALFKHWINLLCLANRQNERGILPNHAAIAFALRTSESKAEAILDELMRAGLIDADETLHPHNWNGRQFRSDNVSERVTRHRSRNDDVTLGETFHETLPKRPRNVPRARATDTEADTDTEAEEKQTTTRKRENGADAPSSSAHPFALLESLCDEIGQDVSVLSEREKGKQLAAAKRLVNSGVTEADVRSMTAWLRGQSWVTSGVDLTLLDKQLGKWQLAGKPSTAPRNGTTANGRASPHDTTEAAFDAYLAGLENRSDDAEAIETTGRVRR